MKKKIRITESQMKKIIAESAKKVLNEAYIGRGSIRQIDTSSSDRPKENPYGSDTLFMLADRFEKLLNKGNNLWLDVKCYLNNYTGYDEDYPEDEKLKNGIFVVDTHDSMLFIDNVLLILTTAKKLFGKNLYRNVEFINNCSVKLIVDMAQYLKNEPRRDMIPQKPNFQTNGITNRYSYAKY